MVRIITVNREELEWHPEMDLFEVFSKIGYTMKVPVVLVKVNGKTIVKTRWTDYKIPPEADILVKNVFCGG